MTSGGKRQTAAALYERVKAVEAEMEAMENALKSTRIENEEVRTRALKKRERAQRPFSPSPRPLLSFPCHSHSLISSSSLLRCASR